MSTTFRLNYIHFVLIFSLLFSASPALAGSQLYQTAGNYTFTVPSGVTQLTITAAGPGGDGGAARGYIVNGNPAGDGGGGGGSGEAVNGATFSVTPGQSVAVTVGSGVTKSTTRVGTLLNLRSGSNAVNYNQGSSYTTVGQEGQIGGTQYGPANNRYDLALGGRGGAALAPISSSNPDVAQRISCNVSNFSGNPSLFLSSCFTPTPGGSGPGPIMHGYRGAGGVGANYYRSADTHLTASGRGGDGTVEIFWVDPVYGTVNIYPNIPGASWTITGPQTLPGDVSGTYPNSVAGLYTITWNSVAGYSTPPSESRTLTQNSAITFTGTYTAIPAASVNLNFR